MNGALLTFLTASLVQHGSAPDVRAVRVDAPPEIDGQLIEPIWERPPAATVFTQEDPVEGEPATERTEVWVAYDDDAVYVAARLHDSEPQRVSSRLGRRDDWIESDWFYVSIDSYHDHRTGFRFEVNPAGVRGDATISETGFNDDSWDAVWSAAARRDSLGWTAEMEIPLSQLRFARGDTLVWGINFSRRIQRKNELAVYAYVPTSEAASVSRYAHLVGLIGLSPPGRVEAMPYVAARGEYVTPDDPDNPFNDGSRFFGSAGVDGKVGLGSNFTLDLTVNPDFGQVEQDPAFVNLSAFEQFLRERRPFFIEGSNIFEFGRFRGGPINIGFGQPQFFYSRRIGRAPRRFVSEPGGFVDTPDETTILGAAKLTGKTPEGWSVGVLDALTAKEFATVLESDGGRREEPVEPFAHYFVGRVQRDLREGAWTLGGLLTAAHRRLDEPAFETLLRSEAYSGGVDWALRSADRTYSVSGFLGMSHIRGAPDVITRAQRSSVRYYQRPDAAHVELDSTRTSLTGGTGQLRVGKDAGEHWLYSIQADFTTPGLETTDLGFMFRADRINVAPLLTYRRLQPGRVFRFLMLNGFQHLQWNFDGDRLAHRIQAFGFAQFLNYWGVDFGASYGWPGWSDTRTRGGPVMRSPASWFLDGGVSSDDRKPVSGRLSIFTGRTEAGGWDAGFFASLEVRPSPGTNLRIGSSYLRSREDAQWVKNHEDSLAVETYGVRHVFGELDQRVLELEIRGTWTFKPDLTLQLYLQPFVASIDYLSFKELARPRSYEFVEYGDAGSTIGFDADANAYTVDPDGGGPAEPFSFGNPDFRSRSLRGTAVLRWEYRPGSTFFLVWQQSRSHFGGTPGLDGLGELRSPFRLAPDNIFLVKMNYWLSL